jgi:hypothetical protein
MGDISRYKGGCAKKMATGGEVKRPRPKNPASPSLKGATRARPMAVGGQVQTMPPVMPTVPGAMKPAPGPQVLPAPMAPRGAPMAPAAPMAPPPRGAMPRMKRGGKVKC